MQVFFPENPGSSKNRILKENINTHQKTWTGPLIRVIRDSETKANSHLYSIIYYWKSQ